MISRYGKRTTALAILLAAGWLVAATPAQADMLGTKVYESTTLVTQPNIDLQTLNITGAGTLTVKLADLQWPDLLGTLSFTLFDATHVIGSYSLDSTLNGSDGFQINAAGTYYASIFAAPAEGKEGGLYNAQIYFQRVAPVSLPAAGWLLISGIAGLASFRPKQKLSQMCA
ncbi:MAG TPA: hypothetical protein VG962_08485 [Steroidobacteraceae bacterium]|nr:hypothetical protein [Steroidobacteraceae bacterium]